jgi:hypothetical protein
MRFVCAISVLLPIVVSMLIPSHGANASERSDFVEWALEQGKGLDNAWNRITAGASHGTLKGSGTTTIGRSVLPGARRRGSPAAGRSVSLGANRQGGSPVESGHWVHTNTNFIHKGKLQRLPLSSRKRPSPSRGVNKLRHPARARLGISHDYRRIPNPRVPKKNFFHSRMGKRRRSPTMGSRITKSARRSRGASRPSYRPARPR